MIRDGWRSEEVREALDLCLACKGCRAECPAGVDLATYKAEFLHHHYQGRLRPRAAYAMGLIPWWARLGLARPRAGQRRGASGRSASLKKARRHRSRAQPACLRPPDVPGLVPPRPAGDPGRPVLLWPDTFTNFFQPEIARSRRRGAGGRRARGGDPPPGRSAAAARSTTSACSTSPGASSGRSWTALRPEIAAGTPVVGLEPSCVAVFRDELIDLFPERRGRPAPLGPDVHARRVPGPRAAASRRAATAGRWSTATAITSAVMGLGRGPGACWSGLGSTSSSSTPAAAAWPAPSASRRTTTRSRSPSASGSSSRPCARPAPETLILADGFSCREQIAQVTGRRPLHLAELLRRPASV